MAVGGIPQRSWPDRSWPDRSIPYAPTGGGGGDDDTQVMTTREGMIDPKWFGLISILFGGKKW